MKYLKNLCLYKLVEYVNVGYDMLCLKMIVSCDYKSANSSMTCRFLGVEYEVTLKDMHDAFGFSIEEGAFIGVPENFIVNDAWHELTGFHNWNPSGTQAGFIRDGALSFLHKFLAYNISGKQEANRVNSNEVFLLWCAKHKKKVYLSTFAWAQISSIKKRGKSHPSLTHIAAGLARHFGVQLPGSHMNEVRSVQISLA